MRVFLASIALMGLVPATTLGAATPVAAIFEVRQDGAGHLTQFEVVGAVEKGGMKPEPMTFPKAYVETVRSFVEAHLKPGDPRHYFTYFRYNPDDPTDLGTPED